MYENYYHDQTAGIVQNVADGVTATWTAHGDCLRVDVPVAVVATLATLEYDPAITDQMLHDDSWTPTGFLDWSRRVWVQIIENHPYLIEPLRPLLRWLFTPRPGGRGYEDTFAECAFAIARAALSAGLALVAGTERRFDADVLGRVLATLRTAGQPRDLVALPPVDVGTNPGSFAVQEYSTVTDPYMKTGNSFRETAMAMRAQGRNPQTVNWIGCDTDPIAVACAYINALTWELGGNTAFYVGDPRVEPNWSDTARVRRTHWGQVASDLLRANKLLDILTSL